MKPDLTDCGRAGSFGFCQKIGWIDGELFNKCLKHFKKHSSPSKDHPVILDGHSLLTKNLQALEYATPNGILMISLLPHTTHKLQPLNVRFVKPLRTYHNRAIECWLRSNPGRQFTNTRLPKLLRSPMEKQLLCQQR